MTASEDSQKAIAIADKDAVKRANLQGIKMEPTLRKIRSEGKKTCQRGIKTAL